MSVEENREIRPVRKKRKLALGQAGICTVGFGGTADGSLFGEQSGSMTIYQSAEG